MAKREKERHYIHFYLFFIILFLKVSENNFHMFFKNYYLFHFIFKNCYKRTTTKHFYEFLKQIFILKNRKLFFNHTTKQTHS